MSWDPAYLFVCFLQIWSLLFKLLDTRWHSGTMQGLASLPFFFFFFDGAQILQSCQAETFMEPGLKLTKKTEFQ